MINIFIKILFSFALLMSAKTIYANDYIQACFKTSKNANIAHNKMKFLKTPNDKLRVDDKCIDIYTTLYRTNLYLKYLKTNFNGNYKISSLNREEIKNCNLQLIKTTKSKSSRSNINLKNRLNVNQMNNEQKSNSTATIKIQNNSTSTIIANDELVKIHCSVLDKGYKLKISSMSFKESISTSISLAFGQTYHLGQVLSKINDKKNSLGITKGFNYNKKNGNSNTSYVIKAMNEL
jgi:hypothetical protein